MQTKNSDFLLLLSSTPSSTHDNISKQQSFTTAHKELVQKFWNENYIIPVHWERDNTKYVTLPEAHAHFSESTTTNLDEGTFYAISTTLDISKSTKNVSPRYYRVIAKSQPPIDCTDVGQVNATVQILNLHLCPTKQ
jgi:hypothetical protein